MKYLLVAAAALSLEFMAFAAPAQQKDVTPVGKTTETESTVKHAGTKTKTQTVIGPVKEYEAGKKIVVTGPKNKDYSFDLDENASVTGDISVGTKVRVSYTKTDGGQKVTKVAPYSAAKKKATKKPS